MKGYGKSKGKDGKSKGKGKYTGKSQSRIDAGGDTIMNVNMNATDANGPTATDGTWNTDEWNWDTTVNHYEWDWSPYDDWTTVNTVECSTDDWNTDEWYENEQQMNAIWSVSSETTGTSNLTINLITDINMIHCENWYESDWNHDWSKKNSYI